MRSASTVAVNLKLIFIGLVILAVAFLRVLQDETGSAFAGRWSWAPYLICAVAVLAVAVLAALAIGRGVTRTVDRDKEI